jgi:peptide/nickel transport system substrate-binding protein
MDMPVRRFEMTTMPRVAAIVVLATAATLSGCAADEPESEITTLRIGTSPAEMVANWDLVTSANNTSTAKPMYESLFGWAPGGNYVPVLATGYEVTDDWRTVTITLRDGVRFSDGEPLTAKGVKTYLDGVSLEEGWWMKSYWDPYSPVVTVVDDLTFEISSETSFGDSRSSFFSNFFVSLAIPSPAVLDDLAAAADAPVGSGPYLVEEVATDVSLTLTKNPDYWDPDSFPFERVEFLRFDDEFAALNALQAGQIDATELGVGLAVQARDLGFTLSTGVPLPYGIMVLDRQGSIVPALADHRVREAIALAFDREAINETINQGFGDPSTQAFDPGTPEYVEGGDVLYPYDPDRARELMAEAGYADGFDVTMPSTPFVSIDQFDPVVQQSLADIGIRVTFEKFSDVGAYFTAVLAAEFPLAMYPGGEQLIWLNFLPDGVLNPFKIEDATIDRLWTIVQGPTDQAAVDEAYDELGVYIHEEAFYPGITARSRIWASREGLEVDLTGVVPFLGSFHVTE